MFLVTLFNEKAHVFLKQCVGRVCFTKKMNVDSVLHTDDIKIEHTQVTYTEETCGIFWS